MSVPYHKTPDWERLVANAINPVAQGYVFPQFASAPSNPSAGFTYFDTTLLTVRTWTGAAWANHF